MFGKFMRAGLVAVALSAGFTAMAGPASAQEFRIGITAGQTQLIQRVDHRRDRWQDHRRDRQQDHRRGGCDARQALHKADRMGINRARVVEAGRRTVTVAGRDRGGRALVRFANARGCPVIGGR